MHAKGGIDQGAGMRGEDFAAQQGRGWGHARAAESANLRAINAHPGEWAAHANLVSLRQQRGDPTGAIDILKKFVEPGRGRTDRAIMAQYRVMMGMSFLMQSDLPGADKAQSLHKAAHWLGKTLEKTRSDSAHIAMALVRMRQGDLVAANDQMRQALELDPGMQNPLVKGNVPHIRAAIKQHGLAGGEHAARQAVEEATQHLRRDFHEHLLLHVAQALGAARIGHDVWKSERGPLRCAPARIAPCRRGTHTHLAVRDVKWRLRISFADKYARHYHVPLPV